MRAGNLAALGLVAERKVHLSSAGFEISGVLAAPALREVLDELWTDDLIDAEPGGADKPAVVVPTVKGERELARAEQESQR